MSLPQNQCNQVLPIDRMTNDCFSGALFTRPKKKNSYTIGLVGNTAEHPMQWEQ